MKYKVALKIRRSWPLLWLCLLIGAVVIFTAIELKKSVIRGEELKLIAKYNEVQRGFEDRAELATSLAQVVASMPEVQKAFGLRNREQLTKITLPFFRKEKEKLFLAQFQFHTAPATSFLRLHKLEKFGDDLSSIRQTVIEVNRTNPVQEERQFTG